MKRLVFSWPKGKTGALTTSWDDGTIHDRRLVSILNRYGIKGTWNLNSGLFGPRYGKGLDRINQKEVAGLFKGHEVAVHTATHPCLWRSPDSMIFSEVVEDRKNLERLTGYPVKGMALPNGGSNDARVINALKAAGIVYCRPVQRNENFELPADFMFWLSTCHHSADLSLLWKKFEENTNPEKLFYIWGHSYEFERDSNWDHIQEFAKLAGKRSNIWYAANMEIYNYAAAWRGLSFSVEMTQVENRSAETVWFRVDGKIKKIKPGQILTL